MSGSVPLLLLVTGSFGFGDDGAFLFGGMLLAVPVALCVCVCGRERSVGRGVGGSKSREGMVNDTACQPPTLSGQV